MLKRKVDGKNIQNAILVYNMNEEYEYISSTLGENNLSWNFLRQELLFNNEKPFDKITFEIHGRIETLYFDISTFF